MDDFLKGYTTILIDKKVLSKLIPAIVNSNIKGIEYQIGAIAGEILKKNFYVDSTLLAYKIRENIFSEMSKLNNYCNSFKNSKANNKDKDDKDGLDKKLEKEAKKSEIMGKSNSSTTKKLSSAKGFSKLKNIFFKKGNKDTKKDNKDKNKKEEKDFSKEIKQVKLCCVKLLGFSIKTFTPKIHRIVSITKGEKLTFSQELYKAHFLDLRSIDIVRYFYPMPLISRVVSEIFFTTYMKINPPQNLKRCLRESNLIFFINKNMKNYKSYNRYYFLIVLKDDGDLIYGLNIPFIPYRIRRRFLAEFKGEMISKKNVRRAKFNKKTLKESIEKYNLWRCIVTVEKKYLKNGVWSFRLQKYFPRLLDLNYAGLTNVNAESLFSRFKKYENMYKELFSKDDFEWLDS